VFCVKFLSRLNAVSDYNSFFVRVTGSSGVLFVCVNNVRRLIN
jgi:hypothetical protein